MEGDNMNIALFTDTYPPDINGVATHVKALRDGMVEAGNNVMVVIADKRTTCHYIKDGILHCPALEVKKIDGYGLTSAESEERFQLVKEFKPDIIHIHTEFGTGLFAQKVAQELNVPLVYTMHTMYDEPGYLRRIGGIVLIPKLRTLTHRAIYSYSHLADIVTAPSIKVKRLLRSSESEEIDVHVVPNPVQWDMFSEDKIDREMVQSIKKKFGIQDDEMIICFCGRLSKEKNIEELLQNFADTVDRRDKIKLMIIGGGDYLEELREIAKESKIEDVVIFTDTVRHEELVNYYACCDMYITASLSDTNSISMKEGMVMGLPVLHIYDEWNKGQIETGKNGFVFHDEEEMYQYMLYYKNKPEEEKIAFRRNVIESVKDSRPEYFIPNLLKIYNQVCGSKKHKQISPSTLEKINKNTHNLENWYKFAELFVRIIFQ